MAPLERITEYPSYNYPHFLAGPDEAVFEAFRSSLHAGDEAPDFELPRLGDMRPTRLSELTAERTVVLEFGSYT